MPVRRTFWIALLLALLAIGLLVGLTWVNNRFIAQNTGGNDFLPHWTGANYWIKQGISPYDPRVSEVAQKIIYGRLADPAKGEDPAHFVYPLFSMIFYAPFGLLKYIPARALWMTFLEVSLIGLALLSGRLAGWKFTAIGTTLFVLFSLFWYYGVRTLVLSQFSAIIALLMVGGLFLVTQERDVEGGILLGLSLCNPQMSYLVVIFAFLWGTFGKRSRLSLSILVTFLLLMGFSMALLPGWPTQWLSQMVDTYTVAGRAGSTLSIIAGKMPGIGQPLSLFLNGLAYAYLLFEWVRAWRNNESWFLWTALMTLVITNLVTFRSATTNFIVLLPPLLLILRIIHERWGRIGQGIAWFILLAFFAGLWGLYLATSHGLVESGFMFLPVPFFCILGLWWVRWWVIRPPKLLFDVIREFEA